MGGPDMMTFEECPAFYAQEAKLAASLLPEKRAW
jgi:hypothetical protein